MAQHLRLAGSLLGSRGMIPEAYGLKRRVAQHWQRFWCGRDLRGLVAAPVYHFADQEFLDSDDVGRLVRSLQWTEPRLPHPAVIFEIGDKSSRFRCQLIYAHQTTDGVEAFHFLEDRATKRWTDVLAHTRFRPDGTIEVETHPKLVQPEDWKTCAEVVAGAVWRAVAVLSEAGTTIERGVSKVHRPRFAGAGIRGWSWHQVEISPERLVRASQAQGGTHASPRWHVRRGHWRQLGDGRRVFVRACEVGDLERGGILKDYIVEGRAA
jgi:hypothetical protein